MPAGRFGIRAGVREHLISFATALGAERSRRPAGPHPACRGGRCGHDLQPLRRGSAGDRVPGVRSLRDRRRAHRGGDHGGAEHRPAPRRPSDHRQGTDPDRDAAGDRDAAAGRDQHLRANRRVLGIGPCCSWCLRGGRDLRGHRSGPRLIERRPRMRRCRSSPGSSPSACLLAGAGWATDRYNLRAGRGCSRTRIRRLVKLGYVPTAGHRCEPALPRVDGEERLRLTGWIRRANRALLEVLRRRATP